MTLLAKSVEAGSKPTGAQLLHGHSILVLQAARTLFDLRGDASLSAVGLSKDNKQRLQKIVILSAAIHDFGKTSDEFQKMLKSPQQRISQKVRHEALTMWLCWPGQVLGSWLAGAVDGDSQMLKMAVVVAAGHHRKFTDGSFRNEGNVKLLTGHSQFHRLLSRVAKEFFLPEAPKLPDLTVEVSEVKKAFECWQEGFEYEVQRSSDDIKALAVAKTLLVCADVCGSATESALESVEWMKKSLAEKNKKTLDTIAKGRLQDVKPRPFQTQVECSASAVTLVRAGCGSGKTVAAYMWAAKQHPGRQLWITYPTTGTATEGFRDYLLLPELDAELIHSRAGVDLKIFDLDDESSGNRAADRLESIRMWQRDVVACTAHTVLGLVQNHRKAYYTWPGLAYGAVVFDEIHAYDTVLFQNLKYFLECFPGIPCLLMTASLPDERLRELRDIVNRVHKIELHEIKGPEDLEQLPRYQRQLADDLWNQVLDTINEASSVESKGKVLWVCNTVGRCMEVAADANTRGIRVLVYHSRFRYIDRVKRHGELIAAFRSAVRCLAVTTQVAEMSLDISADLLITDLAPIPALIQRLGRLNRRASPGACRAMKFLVKDFTGRPYEPADLQLANIWLDSLPQESFSQLDLVEHWPKQPTGEERRGEIRSEHIGGLFSTKVGPLTETTPGLQVVLESDVEQIEREPQRLPEFVIPMIPKGDQHKQWRQVSYAVVAPASAIVYSEMEGARWR